MSKYGNRRVTVEGLTFDSQAEARRYSELLLLERADAISGLRVHVGYRLQEGFLAMDGQRVQPITYVCDFQYTEEGRVIVEDVKGVSTAVFRIKERLFRFRYPEIELRIVRT